MSTANDKEVTLRRSIEQAIHCLVEADSVLKNKEDPRCASEDVWQAQELIHKVIQPGIAKIMKIFLNGKYGKAATTQSIPRG